MTEMDMILEQQFNNYKEAVLQIIENNTNSLVDDDIMQLVQKPPLDSMDIIKSRFLMVAKKENIVVNTEEMEKLLITFRAQLGKSLVFIKKVRVESLEKEVLSFDEKKENAVIKITKKKLADINKRINCELKKVIKEEILTNLISKMDRVYVADDLEGKRQEKIFAELTKFFQSNYQKQFIENINFKILVKDTTLINGVREQGERYLFTKENSRFNDIFKETK